MAPVSATSLRQRPGVLCILDGWGWRPDAQDNAIAQAGQLGKTPNFEQMLRDCPHALLSTSGRAVGLPDGQMGNSEVGHMNIGSGRVMLQDLPRIDDAIANGSIAHVSALLDLIGKTKGSGGAVHVMGLLSPGGVHSHQDHIAALVRALSAHALPVFVHGFLDGRDVPPKSALEALKAIEIEIAGLPGVRLATISGRFYAMDRDKRWDRVSRAYDTLVSAAGGRFPNAIEAVEQSYATDVTDEFVLPCAIGDYAGMSDGDAMLFANFRADRAREICAALLDPSFSGFERTRVVAFCAATGLTEYSKELSEFMTALFSSGDVHETIGEYIAKLGLKQFRIAETEKYAHVTFFLNGGREAPFEGEDRAMIPSPKVATYDQMPEMSAAGVTDKLEQAILSSDYDLVVVNYANPDMVGHSGDLPAAMKAVETVDGCLGRLRAAVEKAGGVLLVTADHGNVELMRDQQTGEPHTAHTTLDVPIIAVNALDKDTMRLENGRLADVAPTLLDLMGLQKPPAMTGHSLVAREAAAMG